MIALSIIAIIYGALVSLMQKDMKKLVAYSSVSHLGFCTLGIFALTPLALSGSVLQQINHGISTGALFLIVGILYERRHTREIAEYGGISNVMPVYATITMIMFLSSMGLPLLNGFVGEFTILQGTFMENWRWGAWAVPGVVLAAAYLLWLYQRVFFGTVTNPKNEKLHDLTPREVLTFVPLLIMAFWIGLYPKPFFQILEQPVNQMVQNVHNPQAAAVNAAATAATEKVIAATRWQPQPRRYNQRARCSTICEREELVGALSQFSWNDYLLALPITLLTLFALGILLIDLMIPPETKWANAVTALIGVVFATAGVVKIQFWMQPAVHVHGFAGHDAHHAGRPLRPLFFLPVSRGHGYLDPDVHALHEDGARKSRRILRADAALGCRHDVHGRRFRHRAYLHRPGTDGDFHLRAGGIPAPRPPLQRGRAEVFVAGRVFVRHFCLWSVSALRSHRQHEPGRDQPPIGAAPCEGSA